MWLKRQLCLLLGIFWRTSVKWGGSSGKLTSSLRRIKPNLKETSFNLFAMASNRSSMSIIDWLQSWRTSKMTRRSNFLPQLSRMKAQTWPSDARTSHYESFTSGSMNRLNASSGWPSLRMHAKTKKVVGLFRSLCATISRGIDRSRPYSTGSSSMF